MKYDEEIKKRCVHEMFFLSFKVIYPHEKNIELDDECFDSGFLDHKLKTIKRLWNELSTEEKEKLILNDGVAEALKKCSKH